MRDARNVLFGLTVLGWFGRKPKAEKHPTVTVQPPPAVPKPAVVTPSQPPAATPPPSLRANQMTCQDCATQFKFFSNADGKPTTCRCPGCGRQYRV